MKAEQTLRALIREMAGDRSWSPKATRLSNRGRITPYQFSTEEPGDSGWPERDESGQDIAWLEDELPFSDDDEVEDTY